MSTRCNTIDIMKAIGILSVVSFHCLGELGLSRFHSFNMPLFFLLSGWAGTPELPLTPTIRKLTIRLAYVYLIFNIFVIVGKYLFPGMSTESPMHGVPGFLIDPSLAPMQISWFLYFLFIYKVFHVVIFKLFKEMKKLNINVSLLVIALTLKLLFYYFTIKEPDIIEFSFYYFLGSCIFFLPNKISKKYSIPFGMFFLITVLCVNIFNIEIIDYTLYSLIGIYGVYSISDIFFKYKSLSKIFIFIGKRTMEIYLFHYFIQIAFRGRFEKISPSLGFIFLFSICILGSLFFSILLEKWKFGRNILLGKF